MRRSGARLGAGTPPAHPDIRDHLDEIAALERVCFPDPWSRDMLAEELEEELRFYTKERR